MALFNGWPWTQFQELNLDWIIKKLKELFDKNESQDQDIETINGSIEDINNDIEDINDDIQNIYNILPQTIITPNVKRIICIGDSIAEGYFPPDGVTGWPQVIRQALGMTLNQNFFISTKGGAGFVAAGQGMNFIQCLQALTIDDPASITDIIVAGGVNDARLVSPNFATYSGAINAFCDYALQNYPNAKIRYYHLNKTVLSDSFSADNALLRYLSEIKRVNLEVYTHTLDPMSAVMVFNADGIHVDQTAENWIAGAIMSNHFYGSRSMTITPNTAIFQSAPIINTIINKNKTTIFVSNGTINLAAAGVVMNCDGSHPFLVGSYNDGFWIGSNGGNSGRTTWHSVQCDALFRISNTSPYQWLYGRVMFYVYQKNLYMVPFLIRSNGQGFHTTEVYSIFLAQTSQTFDSGA